MLPRLQLLWKLNNGCIIEVTEMARFWPFLDLNTVRVSLVTQWTIMSVHSMITTNWYRRPERKLWYLTCSYPGDSYLTGPSQRSDMPPKSIKKIFCDFCPFSPSTHVFEIHWKLESRIFIQKQKVQTCSELSVDNFESKNWNIFSQKWCFKVTPLS